MIMRCVFCKCDSSLSSSAEHIIPESLGNIEYVLPPGVVCDKCNNYIARKIEKPLLDSEYFRERRFHSGFPNKKKRIPGIDGVHLQSGISIQFLKKVGENETIIGAKSDADDSRWLRTLQQRESGTLIIPIAKKPEDYLVSRFVGKVGLEVLAHRVLSVPGALEELVIHPGLEELRQYVRIGSPGKVWPYSHRSIYPPDFIFTDEVESYQVPHEFDILVTSVNEYYIVLAMFGEEYSLNLGGPEIDGYESWLEENNNISPLYYGEKCLRRSL